LRCQSLAVAHFCARVTSAATSSGTNPVIGAPSASRLAAWHSVSSGNQAGTLSLALDIVDIELGIARAGSGARGTQAEDSALCGGHSVGWVSAVFFTHLVGGTAVVRPPPPVSRK
jgi:hypothetical protein